MIVSLVGKGGIESERRRQDDGEEVKRGVVVVPAEDHDQME
jgi:hypothetical protein